MASLAINVATKAAQCAANAACRNAAFAATAATVHATLSAVKNAAGAKSESFDPTANDTARASNAKSSTVPATTAAPSPKPPNEDCDNKINQFYSDLDGYLKSGAAVDEDKSRDSLKNYNDKCEGKDPYFNERSAQATRRHYVSVKLNQSAGRIGF